jgi:hypothetical protein
LVVSGGVLGLVGLLRVPSNCTVSSHQCAAPPGDAAFDDAAKAVRLSNVGWALSGVGAAALAAGIVWYFKTGPSDSKDKVEARGSSARERRLAVAPWVAPASAGLSLAGRM